MNIDISRDDIKQVYDIEWKKKLESETYESLKTLPISYMDKFLRQLKEKFEFEFISNFIDSWTLGSYFGDSIYIRI